MYGSNIESNIIIFDDIYPFLVIWKPRREIKVIIKRLCSQSSMRNSDGEIKVWFDFLKNELAFLKPDLNKTHENVFLLLGVLSFSLEY